MKQIELLSPAGDFECLKKAVFAGANAVYFGAKNFNARAKANNFGSDLLEAVGFCHMYDVKAYLTLNTLIENDQIEDLVNIAKYALDCGVDAFIVQDFGVLNLLKNCFKNVEIHTSTQMAVNNYLGAIKAEQLGAKRVVLSRETSLNDIKLIKEKTNLEIEYFIQGALCVCFSGNCYLSSKLFNKSGNKGECLQPCRLPYKAMLKGKVIKEGYLLSAKDLCFAGKLKDLIDAGVDSFKIEGRLRRSAYVAGVTKTYRSIIDNNLKVKQEDLTNIKKCFNRGNFTEGYFNGNGNIIDSNIQGHKGIEVGTVIDFIKGKKFNVVKLKTNQNINKGDGLKFIHNQKEVATITAMDIKKESNLTIITTTANIVKGSTAHLILDAQFEQDLNTCEKKLPVNFKLIALADKNVKLEYEYKNIKGEVVGDKLSLAQNRPLTTEEAKEQLKKLGDTNFYLDQFELVTDSVFAPKQVLNGLRKAAINEICNVFINKTQANVNQEYLLTIQSLLNDCQNNKNKTKQTIEIGEKYNSNANFLVVKPINYNTFDYSKIEHKNAFLYVPSFLAAEDIAVINNILTKYENLGVYAENIGTLAFNKKTILGAKLNLKNVAAIKEVLNNNVVAICASPELSEDNFNQIDGCFNLPIFKTDFKNFDLMTFVHCPIKTLFGNTCADCKFSDDIIYVMENGTKLKLNRYILKHCYFTLTQI